MTDEKNEKLLRKIRKEFPDLAMSLDCFDMGRVIGKGGFGQVYVGLHRENKSRYAIKQLFENRLTGNQFKRFLSEVKTMASCNHRFLLPIFGFTFNPPYSIITPFMHNGSLHDYLFGEKKGELSNLQLNKIAICIASGMRHIHSMEIIHRDLKAGNILIDEGFLPKICDFGIARFDEGESAGMTRGIGTPVYMAPELALSNDYTTKIDVYAFAMLMYEMSEKSRPFHKMQVKELRERVIMRGERPRFANNTPSDLQELINQCWDPDPNYRPSFDEIYETMRAGDVRFLNVNKNDITSFISEIENSNKKDSRTKSRRQEKDRNTRITETENSNQFSDNQYLQIKEITHTINTTTNYQSTVSNDPIANVLSNFTNPQFINYVTAYSKSLDMKYFSSFVGPLLGNFDKNPPSAIIQVIVEAANTMMERNHVFIYLFAQSAYFSKLPMRYIENFDSIVDSFSYLFRFNHEVLSQQSIINQVNLLLMKRTEKMLILFSFLFVNPANRQISEELINTLISIHSYTKNDPNGILFLRTLFYLCNRESDYRKTILIKSKDIFLNFLSSSIPEISMISYRSLINCYDRFDDVDISVVISHLDDPNLSKCAVSLLLRYNSNYPTSTLISSLFKLSNSNRYVWIILYRIALTHWRSFPLNGDFWVSEAQSQHVALFKLFLILFSNKDIRSRFLYESSYYKMLNAFADANYEFFLNNFHSILFRQDVTPDAVKALSQSGFLKKYFQYTKKSNNRYLQNGFLVVFSRIVTQCYLDDYHEFLQFTYSLFHFPDIFISALQCLVFVSSNKQCALIMLQDSSIMQYITSLLAYPVYQNDAKKILENLANSKRT